MAQITGYESQNFDDTNYHYILQQWDNGKFVDIGDYEPCETIQEGMELAEKAFNSLFGESLLGRYRKIVAHKCRNEYKEWEYTEVSEETFRIETRRVRE